MRVIVFGATGMVGQGVVRECLRDPAVTAVLVVGRRPSGVTHARVQELIVAESFAAPFDWGAVAPALTGYDACFFCLGVSAAGLSEAEYTHITHDLTLAVADTLARANPGMTFVYVSGQGTDATERGRAMWARVKGRTENALQRRPFQATYLFRPGAIIPVDGVRSSTAWYRLVYTVLASVLPLLQRLFPSQVVTSAEVGRAMLAVARQGYTTPVLEPRDIGQVARGAPHA